MNQPRLVLKSLEWEVVRREHRLRRTSFAMNVVRGELSLRWTFFAVKRAGRQLRGKLAFQRANVDGVTPTVP
jgi:hypothetical protein